jgi:hypothetical protein
MILMLKKRAKFSLRTTSEYKVRGDKITVKQSLYRPVTGPKGSRRWRVTDFSTNST